MARRLLVSMLMMAHTLALQLPQLPTMPASLESAVSRRWLVQSSGLAAAAAALGALPNAVSAADAPPPQPSRMGGLLEPYSDVQRGFKLYKPANWNKARACMPVPSGRVRPAASSVCAHAPAQFDVDPGVFDVKFQDIIEPFETVQVSTSPVSTATSVDALGELAEVGTKMAKSRGAEIVGAGSREADGSLMYMFDMKGPVRRVPLFPAHVGVR